MICLWRMATGKPHTRMLRADFILEAGIIRILKTQVISWMRKAKSHPYCKAASVLGSGTISQHFYAMNSAHRRKWNVQKHRRIGGINDGMTSNYPSHAAVSLQ